MPRLPILCFLLGILCPGSALEIKVVGENDLPLAYAVVQNHNSRDWLIADESGLVNLPAVFTPGDTISISRFGFDSRFVTLPDSPSMTVVLTADPILLGDVTGYGSRAGSTADNEFYIMEKSPAGDIELSHLLQGIPGLSLRSYGGPASIKTISLDGGPASHTKILVDDFDISNIQNGETDISQLPAPFIDQVRYLPITTGHLSGSADGTVALDPWVANHQIKHSRGSFGHKAAHLATSFSGSSWKMRLLLGQRRENGDYTVKWRDQIFTRTNNSFKQSFAAANGHKILSERLFLKTLSLYSEQNRGVAGLVYSPSTAKRRDAILFNGATIGWITKYGLGNLRIALRSSHDHFRDDEHAIDSEHTLATYTIAYDQVLNIRKNLSFTFGSSYDINRLESIDTGEKVRYSSINSLGFSWQLLPTISFDPAVKHYSISGQEKESLGQYGITWRPALLSWAAITWQGGESVRYPTFNELFWKPGGNPDLLPEHTTSKNLIGEFTLPFIGQINCQLFDKRSSDLIQWQPQGFYWSPQNIKKVSRVGWRLIWQWSGRIVPLRAFLSIGEVSARFLEPGTNYGKQLVYTPRRNLAASITWTPNAWTFHWQGHQAGKMITRYSWPEDLTIDEIILHQLSAGYRFDTEYGIITAAATVDNLTDQYYESVQGFPEPGRSLRLAITIEK